MGQRLDHAAAGAQQCILFRRIADFDVAALVQMARSISAL